MDKLNVALRGLQLFFIVILTGLIGNVIATNLHAAATATAAINFSMFVIVLGWLTSVYGILSDVIPRVAYPVALLALDVASTLFSLICGIVLAAKLKAVNCADTAGQPGDWIAYGSANDEKRCRQVQASTAFMWFMFAGFTASLVLSLMSFRRGGGSVRTGPTMSQIGV